MKCKTAFVVVCGLLVACSAFAADFWQKKKYTDWTDEDIRKLMSNSPWAKTVTVALKGFGGPPAVLPMGGGGGGGARRGGGGGDAGDGGGGAAGGDAGPMMGGGSGTQLTIRWRSALPVRQAIARYSALRQAPNAAAAADALTRPMQVYSVEIEGLPAKAVPMNPEEVKTKAELRVKNQPPLRPADVRMEMQGRSMAVYLLFYRTQQGAREIQLADNEVEVFLQLEAGKISKKFKLKDMVFAGQLEL